MRINQITSVMLLLGVVFTLSCQKEFETTETDISFSLTVEAARQWYENNHRGLVALKSKPDKVPFILEPEWKNAFTSKSSDFEVVETDLISQGRICMAMEESQEAFEATGEVGYQNSFPRLVVMKNKKTGEMVSFLMTMIGTKEYLEKHKFKMWDNNYLKKKKDFSGMVLFHDTDGLFVNGWMFTDGKVTHTVKRTPETEEEAKFELSRLKATTCYEHRIIETTYHSTDWYVNGEYAYTTYGGTSAQVLASYTVCYGSGGNTGGGDGGSGGAGGYAPGVTQGGSSAVTTLMKLPTQLTSAQLTRLKVAMSEYIDDCAKNIVYRQIEASGRKFDFRIAGAYPAGYKPGGDYEFLFRESATIDHRYLREEMFHAYQDIVYSGGTRQYLNTLGHYNIELEAKMFEDMLCVYRGGGCISGIDADAKVEFKDATGKVVETFNGSWQDYIRRITNQGQGIPNSLQSKDLTIYYAFLKKYATMQGNVNWANMTMAPDKLFDLIRLKIPSSCVTKR